MPLLRGWVVIQPLLELLEKSHYFYRHLCSTSPFTEHSSCPEIFLPIISKYWSKNNTEKVFFHNAAQLFKYFRMLHLRHLFAVVHTLSSMHLKFC